MTAFEMKFTVKPLGFSVTSDSLGKNAIVASIDSEDLLPSQLTLGSLIKLVNGKLLLDEQHWYICAFIGALNPPLIITFIDTYTLLTVFNHRLFISPKKKTSNTHSKHSKKRKSIELNIIEHNSISNITKWKRKRKLRKKKNKKYPSLMRYQHIFDLNLNVLCHMCSFLSLHTLLTLDIVCKQFLSLSRNPASCKQLNINDSEEIINYLFLNIIPLKSRLNPTHIIINYKNTFDTETKTETYSISSSDTYNSPPMLSQTKISSIDTDTDTAISSTIDYTSSIIPNNSKSYVGKKKEMDKNTYHFIYLRPFCEFLVLVKRFKLIDHICIDFHRNVNNNSYASSNVMKQCCLLKLLSEYIFPSAKIHIYNLSMTYFTKFLDFFNFKWHTMHNILIGNHLSKHVKDDHIHNHYLCSGKKRASDISSLDLEDDGCLSDTDSESTDYYASEEKYETTQSISGVLDNKIDRCFNKFVDHITDEKFHKICNLKKIHNFEFGQNFPLKLCRLIFFVLLNYSKYELVSLHCHILYIMSLAKYQILPDNELYVFSNIIHMRGLKELVVEMHPSKMCRVLGKSMIKVSGNELKMLKFMLVYDYNAYFNVLDMFHMRNFQSILKRLKYLMVRNVTREVVVEFKYAMESSILIDTQMRIVCVYILFLFFCCFVCILFLCFYCF